MAVQCLQSGLQQQRNWQICRPLGDCSNGFKFLGIGGNFQRQIVEFDVIDGVRVAGHPFLFAAHFAFCTRAPMA